MPLLPRNHRRSGRAPVAMLLIVLSLLAIPLILIGAAPQWWTAGNIYHMEGSSVATSSDYSPANLGQLKHFAVTAYDYLHSATSEYGDPTAPVPGSTNPALRKGGIGWRLRASLDQFVEFNVAAETDLFAIKRDTSQNIVKRTSSTTADYAMLNQGQLKAIASLFYERLDGIYAPYPVPRPWGPEHGGANDFAPVTLGQLKNTFSFNLSQDSDGDGVSDIDEIQRIGGSTNPFSSDSDGDGMSDADEIAADTDPNDSDTDGDGFLDGEDRWPADPRRGDYIPPKFFAVTDLSPNLPVTDPYYYSVPRGITINEEHQVAWVLDRAGATILVDEDPGDGTRRLEVEGPWQKILTWGDGVLSESSEIANTYRTVTTRYGTSRFRSATTSISHGIVGVTGGGLPFGSLSYYYETTNSEIFDYTTNSKPYNWTIQKRLLGDSDAGNYERSVTIHSLSDAKPLVPGVAVGLEWSVINQVTNDNPNPTGQEKQLIKVFQRTINHSGSESPMQYFSPQGEIYTDNSDPLNPILVHKLPVISKASANGNVLIGVDHYEIPAGSDRPYPYPQPVKNKLWLASDNSTKVIPGNGIAVNNAGQVIGVTNTDENAINTGAFFAWMDASGAVQNMKLERLLIWTNKPAGVKDDYDRYFNRIAKNGTPIEPQLRKIQPLFLSDAALAAKYGSFNGENFPGGAPEHIMAKAEMASERLVGTTIQKTWVPVELMFSLAPGLKDRDSASATEWRYILQVIEMPPGVTFTPTGMNISGSISGSGTLVELSDPHPELKPMHVLMAFDGGLLVDKNHNGTLENGHDDPVERSLDTPTPEDPFVFWVNEDHDIGHTVDGTDWEEYDVAGGIDYTNTTIDWERDLEDFARLQIDLMNATEAVSQSPENKLILRSLPVRNENGTLKPAAIIRIFEAENKGVGYLIDPATSLAQIGGADARQMSAKTRYAHAIGTPLTIAAGNDVEAGSGYVGGVGGSVVLPKSARNFIFEGCLPGECDLYLELRNKADDTVLARSGTVRIVIKKVEDMFEQWTVGDVVSDNSSPMVRPAGVASVYSPLSGTPFQFGKPNSAAEHQYILFVHGWNLSPDDKNQFASTAFKRLYWTGYQGRFGVFRWPTDYQKERFGEVPDALWNHSNFDRSEENAWNSGLPLARLLGTLNRKYNNSSIPKSGVNMMAHSMGNVVAGEALRIGAAEKRFKIRYYVASQAAVPAQTYQAGYPSDLAAKRLGVPESVWNLFIAPNIYPSWFASNQAAVTRRVNFYNPNDFALWHDAWEVDQALKPNESDGLWDQPYSYHFNTWHIIANDTTFWRTHWATGWSTSLALSKLKDRYTIMAFAAESHCRAMGRVGAGTLGHVFNAMDATVDLQDLWKEGGGDDAGNGPAEPLEDGYKRQFGAHKWHSAQFRSTQPLQSPYWQALVSDQGFELIAPKNLPKKPPTP